MSEPHVSSDPKRAREADRSAIKHGTWPHGTPALRIGKVRAEKVTAPPAAPRPPSVASARAPWYLRLLRLAVGLTLLVMAWCGVLAVGLLADSALRPMRPSRVALDTAEAVVKMAGACWVGVATFAAIIAGAFSLTLALTNRDWR